MHEARNVDPTKSLDFGSNPISPVVVHTASR